MSRAYYVTHREQKLAYQNSYYMKKRPAHLGPKRRYRKCGEQTEKPEYDVEDAMRYKYYLSAYYYKKKLRI